MKQKYIAECFKEKKKRYFYKKLVNLLGKILF